MRTAVKFKKEFKLISEMVNDSTFQIFEYDYLKGTDDIYTIRGAKYLFDSGITLKQVRILLDNSAVKVKNEIFSYIKGDINSIKKISNENTWAMKIFSNEKQKEPENINVFEGHGEIVLKSNLGYFTLIELEDEEIIIDEDIFYVCEETISIICYIEKSANCTINNEKGINKLKLKGNGIVVLKLEVPEDEIMRVKIFKDKLYLNDEVEVLRTNSIKHNVENINVRLKRNDIQETFLVDMYYGTGEVWILPTKTIYEDMKSVTCNNELYEEEHEEEVDE